MGETWRIKDWGEVFEDYRSREVQRLTFLRFPLDRDSEAYKLLVQTAAGVSAYGVFMALVIVASRCPVRGVLADDRGPLTPERLAVRTHMPVKVIKDAIKRLSDPMIGWLQRAESTGGASTAHRPRTDGPPTDHRPTTDPAPTEHRSDTDRSARALTRAPARQHSTAQHSNSNAAPTESAAAAELAKAGISEPTRSELVQAGVTAGDVRAAVADLKPGKGLGVLVNTLRAVGDKRTAEIVAAKERRAIEERWADLTDAERGGFLDHYRRMFPNLAEWSDDRLLREMHGSVMRKFGEWIAQAEQPQPT